MNVCDDSTVIERAVEEEMAKLRGAQAAGLEPLTLGDVLGEVMLACHHIEFSQADLERIRSLFGLSPRKPRLPANVINLSERRRSKKSTRNTGDAA